MYAPKTGDRESLYRFVDTLKAEGVKVAGILQQKRPMEDSGMMEVVAVDIQTGRTCSLNRPTRESWTNRECSLDRAALTETTAILHRAVMDGADLIVVEKFGDEEAHGGGLNDEILNGIASGIPFLVAVPETNLESWSNRTGGSGTTLTFEETAFKNWWKLCSAAGE
ncbi:MAG: DUF2478 domain-containing protein [Alphaproteobacteria bacterium]|nr:DUF2478 domain-containing protein [Alphaproteobacteria bacterium]